MRRCALAAIFWCTLLIGVASSGASNAETHTTQTIGAWSAFEGTDEAGVPVCGVINVGKDGRAFLIKRWAADAALKVQVHKSSWQIPKDLTVRVEVEFDSRGPWTATAGAVPPSGLWVKIPEEKTEEFLRDFAVSDQIFVRFPEGNEGAWAGGLAGSAKMTFILADCISRLESRKPTQPYGATQPYSPPAKITQPFARGDTKL